LTFLVEKNCPPDLPNPTPGVYLPYFCIALPYIMQSKGLKTQVLKRFCNSLITLPKELLPMVRSLRVSRVNFLQFVILMLLFHWTTGAKAPQSGCLL